MTPVPKFSNGIIALRPFTPEDLSELHRYLNHPDLSARRYIHWDFDDQLPLSQPQVGKLIEKWNEIQDGFCYAVVKTGPEASLIGHLATDWGWDPHMPDCAVVISPEYQRQGFATQALTLLLNFLFDFTVAHNVSNGIEEWNQPAIAFAEKMGFTKVGLLRRETYRGGRFYDDLIYDILKPEWKESRNAA